MSRRSWILLPLVSLAAFLTVAGCGGSGGDGDGGGEGGSTTLRVLVTDAPFSFGDVKSATVEIQRIDLHERGAAEDTLQTLVTFSPGRVIDLVDLQNGVAETLFEGNPPPGEYDSVRIVVLPKQIVIDDGAGGDLSYPFKVPSGPQTGIKVLLSSPISVVTSLTTDLVLDFDLSRSFVVQGNPNTPAGIKGFHFKPVVRAVNRSTAGTLTFLVKSDNGTPGTSLDDTALDGAVCTVTDAGDVVVASSVSGPKPSDLSVHGFVSMPAIPAGTYTLTVTAAGHDLYTAPVTIVAGNLTDLQTVTLVKTLGAITGFVTTKLQPLVGEALEFAVEGAAVQADGVSAQTDSAGAFQLSGLLPGSYAVTVEGLGYAPLTGTGTAWTGGSPVSSDFELIPLTEQVIGTVRNAANAVVVGATVAAEVEYAGNPVLIAQTTTGLDGTYALVLPTASYEIRVGSTIVPLDVQGGTGPVTLNLTVP